MNRKFSYAKLAVLSLWLVFAIFVNGSSAAAWKVLEGCSYVPNELANDGDSFWIQYKSKKMKFRLYFVDTPETSDEEEWAKARLQEQAEYFKSDVNTTLHIGLQAKKFTQKLLSKSDGFTVYTKMEEAMGRGKQRYYAMVEVNGRFLSEQLVENGFVRINKKTMVDGPLPNRMSVDKYEQQLRHLEQQARREGVGGWASKANQGRNTVAKILDRREGQEAAPAVQPEIVSLKRSLPVYSLLVPGKLVRLLRPETKIKIMGPGEEGGMVVIRFNIVEGLIHEAQCQMKDL